MEGWWPTNSWFFKLTKKLAWSRKVTFFIFHCDKKRLQPLILRFIQSYAFMEIFGREEIMHYVDVVT